MRAFRILRQRVTISAVAPVLGLALGCLFAAWAPETLLAQQEAPAESRSDVSSEGAPEEPEAPSKPEAPGDAGEPAPSPEPEPPVEPAPGEGELPEAPGEAVPAPEAAPAEAAPTEAAPPEAPSEPDPEAARREASRRRRAQARARRQASISSSLQELRTDAGAPRSAATRSALISQIAQTTVVELGSLREQVAAAKLELERLRSLQERIVIDRRDAPAAVRAGRIPGLAATERWNELAELSDELQETLDDAFSERLKLLSDLPRLEEEATQATALVGGLSATLAPALRSVMRDAAQNLQGRLEMTQELLDIYNEQAVVATQAYDEASHYSEELGEAMVAARRRGLQARVPTRLSRTTFVDLAGDLSQIDRLVPAAAEQYRTEGRPFVRVGESLLRGAVVLGVLVVSVLLWLMVPSWIRQVAEGRLSDDSADKS